MRFALCALLFPSLRKSAAKYSLENIKQDYILQWSYVFVCRRLPTNKKNLLCDLCVSAVNKSSSAKIGENRRLIVLDPLPLRYSNGFG